jgi:hypothetical protein
MEIRFAGIENGSRKERKEISRGETSVEIFGQDGQDGVFGGGFAGNQKIPGRFGGLAKRGNPVGYGVRHGTRGKKTQGFSSPPALILAAFGTDFVIYVLDNP